MENLHEIPWEAVPEDNLKRMIEEFVTRDGTDYGEQEMSLKTKVQQVLRLLKSRDYVILFNEEENDVQIWPRQTL